MEKLETYCAVRGNANKCEQESLADAKVSARQQCVALNDEIYSKSTISYWWLIVIMAVLLAVCKLENRHFHPLYCDCGLPSKGTASNINVFFYLYFDLVQMLSVILCNKRICMYVCMYVCNLYIAVRCKVHLVGYLHSFSRYCLPDLRNHAKFREYSNLLQVKVIQGHRPWCQSKRHMQLLISH